MPNLLAQARDMIDELADEAGVPVVHTAELLDWATGGPRPSALKQLEH